MTGLEPSQAMARRTFAIISHPDAGKTTLTEKLLWFGGAIQIAGAIRARKSARHAVSDWMAMERERGISVTTSVMSFPYPRPAAEPGAEEQVMLNLLDTPGHADFGEDTYRVLTAVDAALMVIDGAKGVEERTRKLIDICRMRNTPIVTFVNKLDRECREPLELVDEVEQALGMACVPMTWPVGMGKRFRGVFGLPEQTLYTFSATVDEAESPQAARERLSAGLAVGSLRDPALAAACGDELDALLHDLELLELAGHSWDPSTFLAGAQTPVYFGSAVNNFGVKQVLDAIATHAPGARGRLAVTGPAAVKAPEPGVEPPTRFVEPAEPGFAGFVFKIQANMDPNHRDRIAFLRVCSGRFTRGMKLLHCRTGKTQAIGNALTFLARDRELVELAEPGDIIGIPNHGTIKIGDTFTEGELLRFTGIPSFSPELFRRVELKSPLKAKQLARGLEQLAEEGAIQVFKPQLGSAWVVGAIGQLQLEVMKHRLESEYGVQADYAPVDYSLARWVSPRPGAEPRPAQLRTLEGFVRRNEANVYTDVHGDLTYLAPNKWNLEKVVERYPLLVFSDTREHT